MFRRLRFERFTPEARALVGHARDEAAGRREVDTHHLLLGLLCDEEGMGTRALLLLGVDLRRLRADLRGRGGAPADVMATLGVDVAAIRHRAEESFGPGALERADWLDRGGRGRLAFTRRARNALGRAPVRACWLGDDRVGSEHVLLALLEQVRGMAPGGILTDALRAADLSSAAVHGAVIEVRRRPFGPGPGASGVPARPRGRGPGPSGNRAATA